MKFQPLISKASNKKSSSIKNLSKVRKQFKVYLIGIVGIGLVAGVFSWVGYGHAQGSIQITGTVTNPSGQGVQNVSVYATDPGGSTVDFGPANTLADGSYELDVDPGTYDFHFDPLSSTGYNSVVESNITVNSNQTINVQFTAATHNFSGTLTDNAGTPIDDALVRLDAADGNTASFVTGADGTYSMAVKPDVYAVTVFNAGSTPIDNYLTEYHLQQTGTPSIDLTTGDVTQNLQVETANIHITVKDSSGHAIPNVNITAENDANGSTTLYPGDPGTTIGAAESGNLGPSPVTGDDGSVDITSIVGTPYGTTHDSGSICALVSGNQVCLDAPMTVTGDTSITLTEPVTHTFSGTLNDASGNPIQDALVRLDAADGNSAFVVTGADGTYNISVKPDDYAVTVFNAASTPIDNYLTQYHLQQTGTPSIDLTTSDVTQNLQIETANIHITVKDASGNTIPNVNITAKNNTNGNTTLYVGDPGTTIGTAESGNLGPAPVTGPDGTVDITSIIGTPYGTTFSDGSICALVSGNQVCLDAPLTVTGDTSITLTEPATHTFSGTLTDAAGNPIQDALVQLNNSNDGNSASVVTGADGTYSIAVKPDTYAVRIFNSASTPIDNYLTEYSFQQTGTPSIDLTTSDVTQSLQLKTANIHITVKDSNGTAIPNVNITAQNSANGNTTLYAGDPGTTIQNVESGNLGPSPVTGSDGSVDITSVVGTVYGTTHDSGSICALVSGNQVCLDAPLTLSGDTTIILQEQPTTPAAPTNLTVPSPTQNPALTWDAVTGATSYNIYRDNTKIDSSTTNNYTDNNASEGTHSYYVTAVNGGGESAHSTTVSNVLVDRTAPTITYAVTPVADSNGYNTGRVTVTFTCTDNNGGSGVASCTNPVTLNDEGIGQTVTGTATDNAGNTTTVEANASLLIQAINAGGSASGNYAADTNFTGGTPYSESSDSTVDTSYVTVMPANQDVYQSSRYGNMSYSFSGLTPGSAYTLRLHFNELYWGANDNSGGVGSRVFNVDVNGNNALSNFDIFKEAGGANVAIVKEIQTTADSNGNVTVNFTNVTDNALVNGLELYQGNLPAEPPAPTITSAAINAGGDTEGSFTADTGFSGGTAYSTTDTVDTSKADNPAPQAVYQTSRYGDFTYTVRHLTPNTNYLVRLHFNEPYWGADGRDGGAGSRLFNVAINGTQVLNSFDVYATAGGANIAITRQYTEPSDSNGNMAIQFTSVADHDHAMVSGIEVEPAN